MPLYGGGNLNKKKGTRRGKGNEQKSGMKGIAAQYITRNKAIKKLQISLKDFRSATESRWTHAGNGGAESGAVAACAITDGWRCCVDGRVDATSTLGRALASPMRARTRRIDGAYVRTRTEAVRLHCDAAERSLERAWAGV